FEVTGNKIRFMQPFIGPAKIIVKRKGSDAVVSSYDFEIRDWFSKAKTASLKSCAFTPTAGTRCSDICSDHRELPLINGENFSLPQPWYITNAQKTGGDRAGRRISTLLGEWGNIAYYEQQGL